VGLQGNIKERIAELQVSAVHQTGMICAGDIQQRRATNAIARAKYSRQLDLGRLTADHYLPGCIQVRDIHIRISRQPAHSRFICSDHCGHCPTSLHKRHPCSWPRFSTSFSPAAKSNAPLRRAVHSPNDKPAAASIAKSLRHFS
jgi:hypothetical protein